MPIYEYVCRDCGKSFEALVQGSTQACCPSCESVKLDKQFSVFAVGGQREAGAELPEACRSCGDGRGRGACGMGR